MSRLLRSIFFVRRKSYVNALLLAAMGVMLQMRVVGFLFTPFQYSALLLGLTFVLIVAAYLRPSKKYTSFLLPSCCIILLLLTSGKFLAIVSCIAFIGILYSMYYGIQIGTFHIKPYRNYVVAKPILVVGCWIGLIYGIPYSVNILNTSIIAALLISDIFLVVSLSLMADVQDYQDDQRRKFETISTRFGTHKSYALIVSILFIRIAVLLALGNMHVLISAIISGALLILLLLLQKRTNHFQEFFSDGIIFAEVMVYWILVA